MRALTLGAMDQLRRAVADLPSFLDLARFAVIDKRPALIRAQTASD
jgi:hypothetical protein